VNGTRKSLEYYGRYPVEHIVRRLHVRYVVEVGGDLFTCVGACVNRHLAYVVQKRDGIADISSQ